MPPYLCPQAAPVQRRANIPAWVPIYPGSSPESIFSARGREHEGGAFAFQTIDSADKVYAYYQDRFRSSGLKVNVVAQDSVLVARDKSKRRSITASIGTQANQTSVTVNYATNK
jgi:hypothetical protein